MGAPGERLRATETCSIQKMDPVKHNEQVKQSMNFSKRRFPDDDEKPASVQTQVFIKED